jgi:hypothetical protein
MIRATVTGSRNNRACSVPRNVVSNSDRMIMMIHSCGVGIQGAGQQAEKGGALGRSGKGDQLLGLICECVNDHQHRAIRAALRCAFVIMPDCKETVKQQVNPSTSSSGKGRQVNGHS